MLHSIGKELFEYIHRKDTELYLSDRKTYL